jgi:hypothetical protein
VGPLNLEATRSEFNGAALIEAPSAVTEIEASSAVQQIAASVPEELIAAALTKEPIVACAARNLVMPTSGTDDVATAAALNLIGPAASDNHVPSPRADDLIRLRSPDDRRRQARALRRLLCSRRAHDRARDDCSGNQHRDRRGWLRAGRCSYLSVHRILLPSGIRFCGRPYRIHSRLNLAGCAPLR